MDHDLAIRQAQSSLYPSRARSLKTSRQNSHMEVDLDDNPDTLTPRRGGSDLAVIARASTTMKLLMWDILTRTQLADLRREPGWSQLDLLEALPSPGLPRPDAALLVVRGPACPAQTIRAAARALDPIPLIVLHAQTPMTRHEALSLGAREWLELEEATRWLPRLLEHIMDRARVSQQLEQAQADARRHALHDPLTQLLNRHGLDQALHDPLTRRTPLSVALIDVDELKAINARFGYAVGDLAVGALAQTLRAHARPHDVLARVGGDKFMIVMPQTSLLDARQHSEHLRRVIKQRPIELTTPHASQAQLAHLTASVGLVEVPPWRLGVAELIALAQAPLHQAKLQGKNRLVMGAPISPEALHSLAHDEGALLQDILAWRAPLRIASQPIIDLSTQAPCGVEMLCRGPQGQLQSPDALFGAALEHNLLHALDLHSLRAALATASQFPAPMRLNVNIFPSTLLNTRPEHLLQLIDDVGLDPTRVCLELNEQQLTQDPAPLALALEPLRARGVLLAIDDVGFGKTCLENLLYLSPSFLKIDKGVLRRHTFFPHVLERLVRIGHILQAQVVVEGVEDAKMVQIASQCGARFAQGFYWGRPTLTAPAAQLAT